MIALVITDRHAILKGINPSYRYRIEKPEDLFSVMQDELHKQ